MHLDDVGVQRLLHGELTPSAEREAREHVAACAPCRDALDRERRDEAEVLALLRHLDHQPTSMSAEVLVARSRARRTAWLRRAAAVVMAIGLAGVAYAAPGSPIRAWVDAVLSPASERDRARTPLVTTALPEVGAGTSGIAVEPGDRFVIRFRTLQADEPAAPSSGGTLTISFVDEAEVLVRAVDGTASFATEVDRLVVRPGSAATAFDVRIPRDAPHVEIFIGDVRVLAKEGSRVTTTVAVASDGRYRLPMRSRP